jgi:hypothetical protein
MTPLTWYDVFTAIPIGSTHRSLRLCSTLPVTVNGAGLVGACRSTQAR